MHDKMNTINNDGLVDIHDVQVGPAILGFERVIEYIRQIKDPYHFRCGRFTITVRFDENGPTLEDCLLQMMVLCCRNTKRQTRHSHGGIVR